MDINNIIATSLKDATGKIDYNMLNDYMFRIVLQKNPEALKNIVSAVLGIDRGLIKYLEVKNTIVPGEYIDEKEFQMDITVMFNDDSYVDIELQVLNQKNWTFRSLHYLCRIYEEGLNRGEDYIVEHAAYQIGFLDFTLFDDHVKFFSRYEMCDVEDSYRFNSNFALFVIDLSQIDKATEKDKKNGLDKWCRLFKAQTWDELKRIAKEDDIMEAIAQEVFNNNSDFAVRKRCRDREEYYKEKATLDRRIEKMENEIEEKDSVISDLGKEISEKDKVLSEKDKALSEKNRALSEKNKALSEKDRALSEKDKALSEKDRALSEKDKALSEKDRLIEELRAQLAATSIS